MITSAHYKTRTDILWYRSLWRGTSFPHQLACHDWRTSGTISKSDNGRQHLEPHQRLLEILCFWTSDSAWHYESSWGACFLLVIASNPPIVICSSHILAWNHPWGMCFRGVCHTDLANLGRHFVRQVRGLFNLIFQVRSIWHKLLPY